MYISNTRRVMAVREVIILESEVGSITDNTDVPNLIDEGQRNWGSGAQMSVIKSI